ncbi:MAG TPA: DUF4926 domain-containing protein [Blastocatellia bacterium]|nr:DUF4926 domain-containing protein [Blastocatellia bacterium]
MEVPKLYDVVILLTDLPEQGLRQGDQGTVVDAFDQPFGYIVEFLDAEGNFKALVDIDNPSLLRVIYSGF